MQEALLVRYDRDHLGTCHIYQQKEADTTLALNRQFFGFRVSTSDPEIASIFGVETLDPKDLSSHYQKAIQAGDFLFGMTHDIEDGRHWFQLFNHLSLAKGELNPSGFICWPKEAWELTTSEPYERIEVVQTLRDLVEERVNADLNQELFKALVDSDTGEQVCFSDYLTPEDALAEAQLQFPGIKFREEDFVIQYRIA